MLRLKIFAFQSGVLWAIDALCFEFFWRPFESMAFHYGMLKQDTEPGKALWRAGAIPFQDLVIIETPTTL